MNLFNMLGALPEIEAMGGDIEKALATVQWYKKNPRTQRMIATMQRVLADPDVKDAIAFLQAIVKDPNITQAIATAQKLDQILLTRGIME